MTTIGILAGSGRFPYLVAQGARALGRRVVICGIAGNADAALAAEADAFTLLHIGKLGALIEFFKKHGVTEACMAGAVSKPRALDVRPDWRAAKVLLRLAAGHKGDDMVLRAVAGELHSEGIRLIKPDTLAPGLQSPPGVLCPPPASVDRAALIADLRFGWRMAKAVGGLDIGQCVVVRSGIVVAVEAIEGTDAALGRAGELGGWGCVAVKCAKPGQDERLDLPSVGARTIELLARHKYAALAVEAGRTLFFDQQESIAAASRANLALFSVPENAEGFFAGLTAD